MEKMSTVLPIILYSLTVLTAPLQAQVSPRGPETGSCGLSQVGEPRHLGGFELRKASEFYTAAITARQRW
jgi:hypothetical protein